MGCGGMFIATDASYFPQNHKRLTFDQAVEIVQRAYELGINYYDTGPFYGDSERVLGTALKDVRDECILATKTEATEGSDEAIVTRLENLRIDHLDLIQMHVDSLQTLKTSLGPGGGLEACKRARSTGLVDFIGVTGHYPDVLAEAIKTDEFDTVLVPVNVVTKQALNKLIPLANERDVGVIAMKTLAAKMANIVTWMYEAPLALFSEEPDLRSFLGKDSNSRVRECLRYVLSQDVSTAIIGFGGVSQVEWAIKVAEDFQGLTSQERERLEVPIKEGACRDCGLCMPCPEKVNISANLRFLSFSENYGLRDWARKLYAALPTYHDMQTAASCTNCGECEPNCPYGLHIMEMLTQTKELLE